MTGVQTCALPIFKTAYEQAAKQATDAEALFKYGKKTLDETLRAQLNEQDMHNTLTQSRLARAQTLVGLYKALGGGWIASQRSEEHTSELQSLFNLVCRLLLEKKKSYLTGGDCVPDDQN